MSLQSRAQAAERATEQFEGEPMREFTLGDIARKPTVAQEAIATADGYLSNAVLPTYSELLAALKAIVTEAGPQFGLDDGPGTINKISRIARVAIARHDKTMAGNFRG